MASKAKNNQLALTSSVFKSSNKLTPSLALSEGFHYSALDPSATTLYEEKKVRAALSLAMIKQFNANATVIEAPVNTMAYILTVSNLLFPKLIPSLVLAKSGTYIGQSMGVSALQIANHFRTLDDDSDNGSKAPATVPDFVIPTLGDLLITAEDWQADLYLVAARWGVEIYPIGKTPTPDNLPGFRVNRISAIARLNKVSETERPELSGDALPVLNALLSVEMAFTYYKKFRECFAIHWVDICANGASSIEEDMFCVTFRLTDGSGLGGPTFILDFLHSYPSLALMPMIKPQATQFMEAVNIFCNSTAPNHQGFVKVIYGSNHRVFATCSRGALLALATVHRSIVESTAARFLDTTSYSGVVARTNHYLLEHQLPPIGTVVEINEADAVEV